MSCTSKDKTTSEAPTYSDILDKLRKETVQKDEAGVDDISRQPYETPDDDIRGAIDSNGCNALLGDSSPLNSINHRKYIPSPLNSPAAARRLTQKLGNQISAKARGSPKLLTKAACKIQKISPKTSCSNNHDIDNKPFQSSSIRRSSDENEKSMSARAYHKQPSPDSIEVLERSRPQHLPSLCHTRLPTTDPVITPTFNRTHSLHHQSTPTTFIQPKSYTNRPPSAPHEKVSFFNSIVSSSWLPSFISGGSGGNSSTAFPALSSKQKMSFLKKNCFANNCPDYNIDMEMHRFGDTGRISNRYQEDRWDVWTTMGEDVNNYEEIIFDDDEEDDEDDDYEENEDEYETEEHDSYCHHHTVSNDVDLVVEHRLECGAKVIHCCEKHHHVCQVAAELKQASQHDVIEIDQTISGDKNNGHKSRNCNDGCESDRIFVDNGRNNDFPTDRKACIASSNSSSSDEFLELPFNDLSVSSGIYGAARNACYMNSNNMSSNNSGPNKRR